MGTDLNCHILTGLSAAMHVPESTFRDYMAEQELHVRVTANFDSKNQILGHWFAATKYERDRGEMEGGKDYQNRTAHELPVEHKQSQIPLSGLTLASDSLSRLGLRSRSL